MKFFWDFVAVDLHFSRVTKIMLNDDEKRREKYCYFYYYSAKHNRNHIRFFDILRSSTTTVGLRGGGGVGMICENSIKLSSSMYKYVIYHCRLLFKSEIITRKKREKRRDKNLSQFSIIDTATLFPIFFLCEESSKK